MNREQLPPAARARLERVMISLQNGLTHQELSGHLLKQRSNRRKKIASIPLGRRWRVLARLTPIGYSLLWLGSHENYNNVVKRIA